MDFNYKTVAYLNEMKAVLIDSKYKVFQIDFENMRAFVNKQDIYKKRNGKVCHVEHKFGRWVQFKKEDISLRIRNYTTYDRSVHGLEEIKGKKQSKYLKPEIQERLIDEYLSLK